MDEHVETLCRRIELYRRYLRDGVDAALAAEYLRGIAEAEAALVMLIRQRSGPPPPPSC
jgi:hypothetical protein